MAQDALIAGQPTAVEGLDGVVADWSGDKQAFPVPWGKAMRAGGTPTSPTSPRVLRTCTLDPCRSHDRVLKRLTSKNHTITPVTSAPNATQIFMSALRRPSARVRPAPTCRVGRFAG